MCSKSLRRSAELREMHNDVLKDLFKNDTDYSIYHYTSPEGLQGIIESNKLRFTNRIYLNDKMEGKYSLDLLMNNYDSIINDEDLNKEQVIKKIKEYKESKIENYGFKIFQCSFSCDEDNLSLWNYYTKDRTIKGYNMKFSSQDLYKNMEKAICKMNTDISGKQSESTFNFFRGKVIYDKDTQINKLKCLLNKYTEIIKANSNDTDIRNRLYIQYLDSVLGLVTLIGTLFKQEYFKFENEYRFAYNIRIDTDNEVLDKYVKFKIQNGMYVPYIDINVHNVELKGINISPTLDYEETRYSLYDFLFFSRKNSQENEEQIVVQADLPIGQSQIPVRY